ncbi:hypothetical protein [Microcoleus sp. FACHB-68]|uniref:hypothetical protein n=1 Tax=Microcoleus sp. FACHB-68 TaxID=2692826 RepID=UPI00168477B1|nr:hypothetical protein [Microcoleus sp. FACHB-68]MBD1936746.1 hypothetical protein [Microcoleus sp. FACHB-68]
MTQFTYAQTQSYPTDEEIQKLMPEVYRQVEYWNQYKEPERQKEAKAFAATWVHGLAIASFLEK